jgi:hypothetical protein
MDDPSFYQTVMGLPEPWVVMSVEVRRASRKSRFASGRDRVFLSAGPNAEVNLRATIVQKNDAGGIWTRCSTARFC